MSRLLVPLLLWNIFYMFIYFAKVYVKGYEMDSIGTLIKKFFFFEYNGFMWFFVPLILIYLSLPFFAYFVMKAPRCLLRLYLILGLLLAWIPGLDNMFTTRSSLSDIYLMGGRFLYFIVAGYYFGHFELSYSTRKRIYLAAICSAVLIFVGTYLLSVNKPAYYKYFLSYTNIPCTITAFGIFVFFRNLDWQNILSKIHLSPCCLTKFSSLSLGIYLIQATWFIVVSHIDFFQKYTLVQFIIMYILCIISVWIIKRIPIMRRMVE